MTDLERPEDALVYDIRRSPRSALVLHDLLTGLVEKRRGQVF